MRNVDAFDLRVFAVIALIFPACLNVDDFNSQLIDDSVTDCRFIRQGKIELGVQATLLH